LGTSGSVSARLFRGVIRSLADAVVVVGARDDRRRRLVVGCSAAAAVVVIDFRRGILDGDGGGAGSGTVSGLIELRRRLGGILSWKSLSWDDVAEMPKRVGDDGDVSTRFEHKQCMGAALWGELTGLVKRPINFRFGT
jgi:hypothetical protein